MDEITRRSDPAVRSILLEYDQFVDMSVPQVLEQAERSDCYDEEVNGNVAGQNRGLPSQHVRMRFSATYLAVAAFPKFSFCIASSIPFIYHNNPHPLITFS